MGRTVVRRLPAALWALPLAGVLDCGAPAGPPLATPRIDFVDGAIEPILIRGDSLVIEGFGFGTSPGSVRFPRTGGGTVSLAPAVWSDQALRTSVPDSATSGLLVVATAGGRQLTATVHILPRVSFDPLALAWQPRTAFPRAPLGVALAVATFPSGGGVSVSLYAAGGAEPLGGDSAFVPDSGVYVTRTQSGGAIGSWTRSIDFSTPRAFAAVAVATRYNSRFDGGELYVIGGIDAAGRAQPTVLGAAVNASGVTGSFAPLEPLPAPVAGAMAVVQRGRIYVIGGADSTGRPQRAVFVGRVGLDGHIDGWYQQPLLPAPRAYGGAVVREARVYAFGGIADSAPPGGGLDSTPARLATGDTASLSLVSGFFAGAWGGAGTLFPDVRSQFATFDLGNVVLVVGGYYAGVATTPVESMAATATGDSLAPFAGPVGTTTIAGQGGGTLIGPSAISWRDSDGTVHGLLVGGFDLPTRLRRAGVWGF